MSVLGLLKNENEDKKRDNCKKRRRDGMKGKNTVFRSWSWSRRRNNFTFSATTPTPAPAEVTDTGRIRGKS